METHVLPNDFFVTQKSWGVCFINELPPETLSHIFELGSMDDGFGEEQDKASGDVPHTDQLDAKTTSEKDIHARDAEMVQRGENKGGDGESASDDTGSSATVVPFAFVVSYVCQYWRNVALSTPSLWTTIVVPTEERPPFERVSTLLERSKNLPIDITVSYGGLDTLHENDFDPPSDADLESLFAMLIPHIHRWRTIKITASEYHHMYAFLSAVSDHSVPAASQLTTLEIDFCEEDLENDHRRFLDPTLGKHFTLFAGSAPLLTRIVVLGVHVDWDQPWIASASNLTDLELAYHAEDVRPSWAQFSTILRSASVLQKLSLCQSGPSGEPPVWSIVPTPGSPADVNAPIQLVRVIDLILEFDTQARTIGFLRNFYLPALKYLYLNPEGDFDDDDFGDLLRELTRPASPVQEQPRSLASRLKSLEISALPCQVECIETLYGELQNLRSLNLTLDYMDPTYLDIISTPCTLPGRGDIWLPRLVTLYVCGASGISLRKLVIQRKVAGVPLSSLYVDRDCGLDDEDVDWLKENVNTFKFIGESDEDSDGDLDEDEWSDVD